MPNAVGLRERRHDLLILWVYDPWESACGVKRGRETQMADISI